MAPIYAYHCTHCDFELPSGLIGNHYVVNPDGERVTVGEMLHDDQIERISGMEYWSAFNHGLLGFHFHCVCFECLATFDMDLEKDIKKCPQCESLHVKSFQGSLGATCPKCEVGKIEANMVAVT